MQRLGHLLASGPFSDQPDENLRGIRAPGGAADGRGRPRCPAWASQDHCLLLVHA
jgi:hypothetical protein